MGGAVQPIHGTVLAAAESDFNSSRIESDVDTGLFSRMPSRNRAGNDLRGAGTTTARVPWAALKTPEKIA